MAKDFAEELRLGMEAIGSIVKDTFPNLSLTKKSPTEVVNIQTQQTQNDGTDKEVVTWLKSMDKLGQTSYTHRTEMDDPNQLLHVNGVRVSGAILSPKTLREFPDAQLKFDNEMLSMATMRDSQAIPIIKEVLGPDTNTPFNQLSGEQQLTVVSVLIGIRPKPESNEKEGGFFAKFRKK